MGTSYDHSYGRYQFPIPVCRGYCRFFRLEITRTESVNLLLLFLRNVREDRAEIIQFENNIFYLFVAGMGV
jgi:hypothetical protein